MPNCFKEPARYHANQHQFTPPQERKQEKPTFKLAKDPLLTCPVCLDCINEGTDKTHGQQASFLKAFVIYVCIDSVLDYLKSFLTSSYVKSEVVSTAYIVI